MTIKNELLRKYDLLKKNFGDKTFDTLEAIIVLKKLGEINDKSEIDEILTELKKENLIDEIKHPNDERKKIYKLKPFVYLLKEPTKDELIRMLKKAADIIRTRVSYEAILVLLFFKRLSDKWKVEYEEKVIELINKGFPKEKAEKEAKASIYHKGIDFPEEFLWDNIIKDPEKLLENFSRALKVLSEKNPELSNIFERIDFYNFFSSKDNLEILKQLVSIFGEKNLGKVSTDVLGDAYEWIISYFAPNRGKEGEVYTPREVIKLMINIVDPKPGEKIYDPALGSAGMLVYSYLYLRDKYGKEEAEKSVFFGQEVNRLTYSIAKMNLMIHDIENYHLSEGDTLLNPNFKDVYGQFDVVLTNIPWNQDGYGENVLKKGEMWNVRFAYGFPPKKTADWAWLQHILFSLNNKNGRAAVVVDNGCLFRGGKEKNIRSKFVENDVIDAIILLPEKLFYNTGAPGVIIVLSKNKPSERKGKILFINASQLYEKHPEVRKLNKLGDQHITKIVEIYKSYKEEPGLSRIVTIDEVRKNDYNLNVTLYVISVEESEKIDIAKEWGELKKLEEETRELLVKIETWITEITKTLQE